MKIPLSLILAVAAIASAPAQATKLADVEWTRSIVGADATGLGSAQLSTGDIILVGARPGSTRDLWIQRVRQDGALVWSRTIPKPGAAGDVFPRVVKVSPVDDIYVVSTVTGNGSPNDYWFVRISDAGTLLGQRTVDEYANDSVGDMEIDSSGDVIFTGYELGGLALPIVVQLNVALATVWAVPFGDIAGTITQTTTDLEVDPLSQNIYVCGTVHDGTQTDVRMDILSGAGALLDSNTVGDPVIRDLKPNLALDPGNFAYLTYVRADAALTSVARLAQYDSVGNFQWNYDIPLFNFSECAVAPNGNVLFAASDDDAAYDTKFLRFDQAGVELWETTIPGNGLSRNLLDGLNVSDDGFVYAYSHVEEGALPGANWRVYALFSTGHEAYTWTFDSGPNTTDLGTGLVPLTGGDAIVSGMKGAFADNDAHAFRLSPALYLAPSSFSVRTGRLDSGSLTSLESDDDDYLVVCKFIVPNQATPPVSVEFVSAVPPGYPPITTLDFRTLIKASTPSLQQDTQLFDYVANGWGVSKLDNLGTSEVSRSALGDPAISIQPGTREVRSRIRIKAIGPVTSSVWCVSFDRVGWRLTP